MIGCHYHSSIMTSRGHDPLRQIVEGGINSIRDNMVKHLLLPWQHFLSQHCGHNCFLSGLNWNGSAVTKVRRFLLLIQKIATRRFKNFFTPKMMAKFKIWRANENKKGPSNITNIILYQHTVNGTYYMVAITKTTTPAPYHFIQATDTDLKILKG